MFLVLIQLYDSACGRCSCRRLLFLCRTLCSDVLCMQTLFFPLSRATRRRTKPASLARPRLSDLFPAGRGGSQARCYVAHTSSPHGTPWRICLIWWRQARIFPPIGVPGRCWEVWEPGVLGQDRSDEAVGHRLMIDRLECCLLTHSLLAPAQLNLCGRAATSWKLRSPRLALALLR